MPCLCCFSPLLQRHRFSNLSVDIAGNYSLIFNLTLPGNLTNDGKPRIVTVRSVDFIITPPTGESVLPVTPTDVLQNFTAATGGSFVLGVYDAAGNISLHSFICDIFLQKDAFVAQETLLLATVAPNLGSDYHRQHPHSQQQD
jgi:hypothetical protein